MPAFGELVLDTVTVSVKSCFVAPESFTSIALVITSPVLSGGLVLVSKSDLVTSSIFVNDVVVGLSVKVEVVPVIFGVFVSAVVIRKKKGFSFLWPNHIHYMNVRVNFFYGL